MLKKKKPLLTRKNAKVTNASVGAHKDLVRDPNSHAIINTNKKAYQEAMDAHRLAKSKDERIQKLEDNVSDMDNKLSKIHDMLIALTNN
jgi:hypothetical protein